jgi:tripartite ATP-independent transporter DctM subunit
MVMVVFLSAALVLDEDQHIRINLVVDRCTVGARRWLTLLSRGLTLVFLVILGWESSVVLPGLYRVRVVTMGGMPRALFYAAIPLGCLCMIVFLLPKLKATLQAIHDAGSGFADAIPSLIFCGVIVVLLGILLGNASQGVVLLLLFLLFITLVLMGMPVAFALGFAGVTLLGILPEVSLRAVPTLVFGGVSPFALLAVPLFILTGLLMEKSGILEDLIAFSDSLVGRLPGGLAQVTILGSMFFACVCGVALASSAAIGAMMIPSMIKQGYSRRFSAAVTASAAILGPIIPPSVGMIIYSNATGGNVSIGGLFLTGLVPGVILGVGMMGLTYFFAVGRKYPVSTVEFSMNRCARTGVRALPGLVIPVVILVGIVMGIFTTSEAGGMTAAYALIWGVFFTRKLKAQEIAHCLLEAAKITAVVFMLLAGAKIISFILSTYQAPVRLTELLQGMTNSPKVFILLCMASLLIVALVMEGVAIMIMLVPVLAPVANAYGINPYHFGLIFVMTIQLALLTPPIALGLQIVSRLAGSTMEEVFKDAWPYYILIFVIIAVIAFSPEGFTLWLPRLAGYL